MNKLDSNDAKGFLLNFFAVVLGIAITFGVDMIISHRQQKAEVRSSLMLVKNELQDNLGYIAIGDSTLAKYEEASKFLIEWEGRYKDAPKDSMAIYCNAPLMILDLSAAEDALDLMKSSNLFTKIEDPEMSLEIIHAYGLIQDRMTMFKMIFDVIGSYRDAAMTQQVKEVLSGDSPTAVDLWDAITSTTAGKQFLRELRRVGANTDSSSLNESIEALIERISERI